MPVNGGKQAQQVAAHLALPSHAAVRGDIGHPQRRIIPGHVGMVPLHLHWSFRESASCPCFLLQFGGMTKQQPWLKTCGHNACKAHAK